MRPKTLVLSVFLVLLVELILSGKQSSSNELLLDDFDNQSVGRLIDELVLQAADRRRACFNPTAFCCQFRSLYWFSYFLLDFSADCGEIRLLEAAVEGLTFNVDQIVSRVKTRTGIKHALHCIRPKRRTVNKEIVIGACKLESAFNALRATVDSAKRTGSPELIKLATEQRNEVDTMINQLESVLNFWHHVKSIASNTTKYRKNWYLFLPVREK